jgi:Zn-dependent protease with chaperone function
LQPSKLPPARQAEIGERIGAFAARHGELPRYKIHFRSAPAIGPNAFALPNGDVVIFDELLKLATDDSEIVAVVAHELAHVAHHHGLRQLLQSAVVSAVAAAYFGDVSSAAAGLAAMVLESRYSREFEFEADAFAGRLLLADGASTAALERMLARLDTAQRQRRGDQDAASSLASHPETTERIAALKQLATSAK